MPASSPIVTRTAVTRRRPPVDLRCTVAAWSIVIEIAPLSSTRCALRDSRDLPDLLSFLGYAIDRSAERFFGNGDFLGSSGRVAMDLWIHANPQGLDPGLREVGEPHARGNTKTAAIGDHRLRRAMASVRRFTFILPRML